MVVGRATVLKLATATLILDFTTSGACVIAKRGNETHFAEIRTTVFYQSLMGLATGLKTIGSPTL
jgi:hypothetical protein